MEYEALLWRDEDSGLYLAEVPDLPGCMSQGATPDDALINIREAIALHVDVLRDRGEPIPRPVKHMLRPVAPAAP
jgi:antitoxin HicB